MYKFFLILLITFGFSIKIDNIYDNSWALIIGIDKYENIQRLHYAVDDAESIKDILINSFGFPADNVSILINEEATKQNIIKSFSKITKNAKSNDRVIIFFAGHGETMDLPGGGERGYLIPVEGDANDLYVTSIPMDELKQIALMSEAKHMLYLVDACYGGIAAVGSRGLAQDQTPNYLKKVTKFQSRQVITAGGRGEKVIEKPEWGHSAFTLNIKRGLKEGAADLNSDGYITANELGMFLSEKVTIDSENQQTPQYGRMTSQEGEFVFVYVDNLNVSTPKINDSDPIPSVVSITKEGTVLIDSSFFNSDAEMPDWLKTGIGNMFDTAKKVGVTDGDSPNEWAEEIADEIGIDTDSKNDTLNLNCSYTKSPTWHFADQDGSSNYWIRYNRSEGLFFQINGVFQSTVINGSSFYGGIGRAFHRNQWQYIMGLEQLINVPLLKWENNFQFYFEFFDKSITNDAWRVDDGLNSLSALFFRKDYLDWYNGIGYRFAGFFHLNNYISIGAEYNNYKQSEMNNVLEGFKALYKIQEGQNVYLKSLISFGHPIDISVREEFQMYSSFIRTNSMNNSDIFYNYDHFLFNILVPYTNDINFNFKLMAGASDINKEVYDEYKQNIFEIGGHRSIRGYSWKQISSPSYQLSTVEIWYNWIGLFFDRLILFESPGNVFNKGYYKDLLNNISENNYNTIGLSFGDSDFHLSIAKELRGTKDLKLYISFGEPLQYW